MRLKRHARSMHLGDLRPRKESGPVHGSGVNEKLSVMTELLKQRKRGLVIRRVAVVKRDDRGPIDLIGLAPGLPKTAKRTHDILLRPDHLEVSAKLLMRYAVFLSLCSRRLIVCPGDPVIEKYGDAAQAALWPPERMRI
jgi:hypothetical protein